MGATATDEKQRVLAPSYLGAYFWFSVPILLVAQLRVLNLLNTARELALAELVFTLVIIGHILSTRSSVLRVDFSSAVAFGVVISASVVGLFHNNSLTNISIDVLRASAFLALFFLFKNASKDLLLAQLPSKKSVVALFATQCFCVASFWIARIYRPSLYASVTEITSVLAFAGLWIYRHKLSACFCAFLLLVGGKRGVFLGFLGAVGANLVTPFFFLWTVFLVPWVVLLLYVMFSLENPFTDFLMSTAVVSKFVSNYNFATNSGGHDLGSYLFRMFDDRASEMQSAWKAISSSWWTRLFGAGAGFEYLVEFPFRDLEPTLTRNVHFSPLSVYAQFGLAGFALFYGIFLRACILAVKFVAFPEQVPAVLWLCSFYCIAFFLNSFTAFSVFLSPAFPICCGIALNPYWSKLEDQCAASQESTTMLKTGELTQPS